MKKLILIILLLGCGFVAWDLLLARHSMPYHTILENVKGESLEVSITRADKSSVRFLSMKDGREYSIPVKELSLVSRYKVLRLSNKNTTSGSNFAGMNASTANYVSNLNELVADNNRKIAKMNAELEQAIANRQFAKQRRLTDDIQRLKAENLRHQHNIEDANSGRR